MQINLSWGNLNKEVYASEVDKILTKNLTKIRKLFKLTQDAEIQLELRLNFNKSEKNYNTVLYIKTPKESHHIKEKGYTLEEAVNKSVGHLRRKHYSERKKKIAQSRQN